MNHRYTLLLGLGFLTGAGVLIACSSDDAAITVTEDGGADGAPDTGPSEAGPAPDAGAETGPPFDAGLTFDSFIDQLSDTYCGSLARCCFGDENLKEGAPIDGGGAFNSGVYNKTACTDANRKFGFEGSVFGAVEAADGGLVTLDQQKALDCIAKVKALKCTLARAEYVAVRDACFGSVLGTGTAGSVCTRSIQCASGFFCNGQTKKCEALRAENAPCGDFTTDESLADEACSWRASGDTNRYCESYDEDGNAIEDAGAWVCKPGRANGAYCNTSAWCGNGMCSIADINSGTCTDPVTYFPRDPSNCGLLVK